MKKFRFAAIAAALALPMGVFAQTSSTTPSATSTTSEKA